MGRSGRAAGVAACAVLLLAGLPASAQLAERQARSAIAESGLTLLFAGDVLLDRGVRTMIGRHDADWLFRGVEPLFGRCDAVCVNLECPVAGTGVPIAKKYIFRAEPEWLPALRRAGITHLTLANNHVNDQGRDGVLETLRNAAAAGLATVGAAARQDSAGAPLVIERDGVRVALFASVLLPLENWLYRDDGAGPSQETVGQLADRVRLWKLQHPGDRAVVLLHWGIEHRLRPTDDQRAEACELIEAGADAVIGHHPHVVQSIEWHRGKPIVYSLGNFVFDQQGDDERTAIAVSVRVSRGGETTVRIHPLRIDRCAPRPMQDREARAFIAALLGRSPRVRLLRREGAWELRPVDAHAGTIPSREGE